MTGRVRAIHSPAGYRGAFVLIGRHGRRLLVVPLQPHAGGRRGRDRVVALGELAERVRARAIVQTAS